MQGESPCPAVFTDGPGDPSYKNAYFRREAVSKCRANLHARQFSRTGLETRPTRTRTFAERL